MRQAHPGLHAGVRLQHLRQTFIELGPVERPGNGSIDLMDVILPCHVVMRRRVSPWALALSVENQFAELMFTITFPVAWNQVACFRF